MEYLYSKLSINKLLWFVVILVARSNIFLLSPFKIGNTRFPITLFISILGMLLYCSIVAKRKTMRFKSNRADYLLIMFFL